MSEDHDLDIHLSKALALGDRKSVALAYERAADMAENDGDIDRACFLLTHAWVMALEAGSDHAALLHERLSRHGRV